MWIATLKIFDEFVTDDVAIPKDVKFDASLWTGGGVVATSMASRPQRSSGLCYHVTQVMGCYEFVRSEFQFQDGL